MSASVPTPHSHSLDTVPDGAVTRSRCEVRVDDAVALSVDSLAPVRTGAVGLFVDIGTEAFFAGLDVRPVRA